MTDSDHDSFRHFVATILASPMDRLRRFTNDTYLAALCTDVNDTYALIAKGEENVEPSCTCARRQHLRALAALLRDTLAAHPPRCVLEASFRLGQLFILDMKVASTPLQSSPFTAAEAFLRTLDRFPFPCACTDKPLYADVAAYAEKHNDFQIISMSVCECDHPRSHALV